MRASAADFAPPLHRPSGSPAGGRGQRRRGGGKEGEVDRDPQTHDPHPCVGPQTTCGWVRAVVRRYAECCDKAYIYGRLAFWHGCRSERFAMDSHALFWQSRRPRAGALSGLCPVPCAPRWPALFEAHHRPAMQPKCALYAGPTARAGCRERVRVDGREPVDGRLGQGRPRGRVPRLPEVSRVQDPRKPVVGAFLRGRRERPSLLDDSLCKLTLRLS